VFYVITECLNKTGSVQVVYQHYALNITTLSMPPGYGCPKFGVRKAISLDSHQIWLPLYDHTDYRHLKFWHDPFQTLS
jgi:hypothetical protein